MDRVIIVIAKELIGAGIENICRMGFGRVTAHILSHCDQVARLSASGGDVCLALLDVDMVEKSELPATIRQIRKLLPSAGLMLAAANSTRNEVLEYLASGAHGVILHSQSIKEIAKAIKLVMSDGIYVPPLGTGARITVSEPALKARPPAAPRADHRPLGVSAIRVPEGISLSARQIAVLRLLARGLSNKAIARELGLSEATVKVHTNAVFKALQVHNRASAVARVLSAEGRGFDRSPTGGEPRIM